MVSVLSCSVYEILMNLSSALGTFRLLKENPELFQLYKDLVVSQVISAEEFWATQAAVSIVVLLVKL